LDDTAETPGISDTPLSDQNDIISEDPAMESIDLMDEVNINFDESELSELDGALKVEDQVKNSNDDFDISMDLDSDALPDFSESGELNELREEGASPITPAPEDTSYLEEDPLASLPDEHIDLSGAVIDEPDLSAHITENPVSEPAIDNISIDLDMEEHAPEEAAPSSDDFVFETEETMEIPAGEEPLFDDAAPIADAAPESDDPFADIGSFTPPDMEDDISFDMPEEEALPDNLGTPDPFADTGEELALDSGEPAGFPAAAASEDGGIPSNLKQELKTVLSYMDQLLESLPEDKIEEFAKSEYFDTYKKLFEELGLV
jgi:hypothetical protein